jgi:hypothetical protein
MKRIDIKEFRELGYLQELNRLFLHPLGMALEVVLDTETGEESLGGIWDSREDLEGIYYDIQNSEDDRISRFKKNEEFVSSELSIRLGDRESKLGFGIEEIKKVSIS